MFLDFETCCVKRKSAKKNDLLNEKQFTVLAFLHSPHGLRVLIRCPSLPPFPLLFIYHSRFLLDALFPSHSTLIFAIPVGSLHVSADNTLSSCNYFANLYPIPSSTHRHHPFIPHSRILNPFSLFSTITQASIKYTFVGGPRTVTVAGYLFFQ